MATSSSSGPPAALPITSLRSLPTNPISWQPRFWNGKTKAWSALAHCANNHREISGTKQSRSPQHPNYASPDSIKLSVSLTLRTAIGTSWYCPLKVITDTCIGKERKKEFVVKGENICHEEKDCFNFLVSSTTVPYMVKSETASSGKCQVKMAKWIWVAVTEQLVAK